MFDSSVSIFHKTVKYSLTPWFLIIKTIRTGSTAEVKSPINRESTPQSMKGRREQ